MTDTAAVALLAVLLGGPAVMLTPFWLARLTAEQHADGTAAAIRREHTRAADRPKELTR
ncbi:hypothetical protein ACIBPB_03770 [Micromonospora sp. NPDC049836]|uniref:hypothetical protein n=1 Tax=Micromonospora sp. NPDC049836 TaxID=3364274 RepID=UPI0037B2D1B0